MSDLVTRAAIKAIFQTGDPLNQAAFVDLIDSVPINSEVTAKQSIVRPIIADVGTEITHVYFGPSGLIDTENASWTAANTPPLQRVVMPAYAGDTTRKKVGPFTASNHFTAGTLFNFPTGPWTAAIEIDHVDSGAAEMIVSCQGGATEGWSLYSSVGAGPYMLTGSFDGPQAPTMGGTLLKGRNTIICGYDGTQLFLKVNGSKVITKTQVYTAGSGTSYVGRNAGGSYYGGKIYEIWGSTDTPTVNSINALYALSRQEDGNNYRFPNGSTTRFHLHAKNFAANTWTYYPWTWDNVAATTLTTVGTVPVSTETLNYPVGDSRYGLAPTGVPAVLTADTSMYYLTGPNNVLNIATSFHACSVLIPDTEGLETTQVYLASGYSTITGGWQLVTEINGFSSGVTATVFIGSTGADDTGPNLNGPQMVGGKVNIVCWGYDAANQKIYLKVNDYPTQIANVTINAVTLTGHRRDQCNIGGHNDMDIGYSGKTIEHIVRSGAPSDAIFIALQREVLSRL